MRDREHIHILTRAQVVRYEARVKALNASLAASHTSSAVSHILNKLSLARGCLLRAWRLDLDIRGTGSVSFVDFAQALRKVRGMNTSARSIWNSLRPDDDPRPLQFYDIGGKEAENLDAFTEMLWQTSGFDLEKSWKALDASHRLVLFIDEFEIGVRRLGFYGDARLLYLGLDSEGIGRLTRSDFEYLTCVTRLTHHRLQADVRPIADLVQWVQQNFGELDKFLYQLGLVDLDDTIMLSDFAMKLSTLGFEGDALQTATYAARNCGGMHITAESLRRLFLGSSGYRSRACVGEVKSDIAKMQPGSSFGKKISPQRNFLNFVMSRFGSIRNAFQSLDVDQTSRICKSDFCSEVRHAGFTGNATAVFEWLSKDRNADSITYREFSRLMEV